MTDEERRQKLIRKFPGMGVRDYEILMRELARVRSYATGFHGDPDTISWDNLSALAQRVMDLRCFLYAGELERAKP